MYLKKILDSKSGLEVSHGVQVNLDPPTEDEEDIHRNSTGRPRQNILDQLTVEVNTPRSQHRKHRCRGKGCTKTWQPRARARVLFHCKRCLKLTSEMRALAAAASASTSPGALVAASSMESMTEDPSPKTITKVALQASASKNPGIAFLPRADSFFGPRGRKEIHRSLDLAILQFICVARLPPSVVDLPEWKNIFAIQTPSYSTASRTKLMDDHIMSEQENVRKLQIIELKNQHRLSLSLDGGALRSSEPLYTIHATTPARKVMLLEGQECGEVSHTGKWIADLVYRVRLFFYDSFWLLKVVSGYGTNWN
jgi:hypothetical protein